MLILLAVALVYTTLGGAVALALEASGWRTCSWAKAAAIAVVCGPVCWVLVVYFSLVAYVRSR